MGRAGNGRPGLPRESAEQDRDGDRVRAVEPVQERRLPGTGRPGDRVQPGAAQLQVEVLEDRRVAVAARQPGRLRDEGRRTGTRYFGRSTWYLRLRRALAVGLHDDRTAFE